MAKLKMNKPKRNKSKLRRKNLIKLILILLAIFALIIVIGNLLYSRKIAYAGLNLNKKMDMNKITLVESKDGIKVPVPKGYTASSVESEMYVNGKYTERKVNKQEELKFTSEGDYPWTQNISKEWISGGQNVKGSDSVLTSNEFQIEKKGFIRLNFANKDVNSKSNLTITINNLNTGTSTKSYLQKNDLYISSKVTGLNYMNFEKELETGRYSIKINYYNSIASTEPMAYVKKVEVFVYDEKGMQSIKAKEAYGGFVIYEGEGEVTENNIEEIKKTRNQWVWVPIENVNTLYWTSGKKIYSKVYAFNSCGYEACNIKNEPILIDYYDTIHYTLITYMNGKTKYELLENMEKEFREMIESVKTYGGYYIARYELGNVSKNQPAVVKGNRDINNINWYDSYKKCKRLSKSNDNVITNLIYGTLWDNTLKWLIDSKEAYSFKVGEGSGIKGNFRNTEFTYNGGTKRNGENKMIPTGSTEYTKSNNIYDLAGNVREWTMEGNDSQYRPLRGGYYENYSQTADYRFLNYNAKPFNSENKTRL